MGVCPQFDILWGELSGEEHLLIYGRIKGLPAADVRRQASQLLESVKLGPAARLRTSAYSGGMRRRLRWVPRALAAWACGVGGRGVGSRE